MRFPEIPTDNLYKFMALSGITIIIISLLPFYHGHKLRIESIRLHGDIEKLEAQISWVGMDVKELKEETVQLENEVDKYAQQKSSLETAINAEPNKPEMAEKLKEQSARFKSELNKIETKNLEYLAAIRNNKTLNIEYKTKAEEHEYLSLALWIESIIAIIGILAGAVLTERGFRLWYKKLQIPQDRIIQMKAEHKE